MRLTDDLDVLRENAELWRRDNRDSGVCEAMRGLGACPEQPHRLQRLGARLIPRFNRQTTTVRLKIRQNRRKGPFRVMQYKRHLRAVLHDETMLYLRHIRRRHEKQQGQ